MSGTMSLFHWRTTVRRRPWRRLLPALLLASILLVAVTGAASAHPLGNFTINRYSRLAVDAHTLRVVYIIDMAEIPAHAERAVIDADGDGVLTVRERERYRSAKSAELAARLSVTAAGVPAPLHLEESTLSFPAGQAGLPTLRLVMTLRAPLTAHDLAALHYADGNYADRIGWQEIVLAPQLGVRVLHSSVAQQDQSRELTAYPQDLLSAPLQEHEADFAVAPLAVGTAVAARSAQPATQPLPAAQPGVAGRPADPFAELVAIPDLGVDAMLLALLAAVGWGAVHAMSPGHGKTIVAAYLVGSRGTAKHALFLGLTTTVTHTAGVFALGLATLMLAQFILPEKLYPWLSALSGLLVVAIGLALVRSRWLGPGAGGHRHAHEHSHEHGHSHAANALAPAQRRTPGSRPPSGLRLARHHDEHHGHPHHGRHYHGPGGHSHLPPGAAGEPVTWRSLLALGISGGLLPCPSALVLMLGAISLNRIGFGLLLIVAFSIGLAGVLTLTGIVLVHARRLLRYVPEGGRIARLAPVASALFITVAGLVITVEALSQAGLLRT